MDHLILHCPHCHEIIFILKCELNCRIFRHGLHKKNLQQIDPHLSKEKCDELILNDSIIGCGKPFRIGHTEEAEICDYL